MDREARRRWFQEHAFAHYLLNVVFGSIGFVVLGGLVGRLLAPDDPFYGFSWPGIVNRAITGSLVMLFVTWYARRLLAVEPRKWTLRQPLLWLLLATFLLLDIAVWPLGHGHYARWQAALAAADGLAMFAEGLALATNWRGFAGYHRRDVLGRRMLGGLCCLAGLMTGAAGLALLLD